MSHLDPEHPLYVADVTCPRCGAEQRVTQVQGDRCPGCGFEVKLFRAEEAEMARALYEEIAGEKEFMELPGFGYAVLHE